MSKELSDIRSFCMKVGAQIQSIEYENKMFDLTLKELNPLSEDCNSYISVGKFFLRQPIKSIKEDISNTARVENKKELESLNSLFNQFTNKYEEKEKIFMDFLKSNNLVLKPVSAKNE